MKHKVFFAIVSIVYCIILTTMHCFAQTEISLSNTENKLIIKGTEELGYAPIKVLIIKQGYTLDDVDAFVGGIPVARKNGSTGNVEKLNEIVAYTRQITADDNGQFQQQIILNPDYTTGIYTVSVNGISKNIGYKPINEKLLTIKSLKEAESSAEVLAILNSELIYFDIDFELYQSSDKQKTADISYEALSKIDIDVNDIASISKVEIIVDRAITVSAANKNKLTNLSRLMKLCVAGENFEIADYLYSSVSEEGLKEVLSNISNQNFVNFKDMQTALEKQIVLQAVNYPLIKTTDAILNAIMSGYKIIDLDISGLKNLSQDKQKEAAINLSNEKPKLNMIQLSLNAIVSDVSLGNTGTFSGTKKSGDSKGNAGIKISGYNDYEEPTKNDGISEFKGYEWAVEAVSYLKDKGIINGYPDGTYKPANYVVREEFVKMVVLSFIEDMQIDSNSFNDVSDKEWYHKYVEIAAYHGIVKGVSADSFGVGKNITRQDIAVILYRISELLNVKLENGNDVFGDDNQIADYAKEAVYTLKNAGIINGSSDNYFNPTDSATRAETAAMIYRFAKFKEDSNEL